MGTLFSRPPILSDPLSGESFYHYCARGEIEKVKEMIAKGVDVNKWEAGHTSEYIRTQHIPIVGAAEYGHLDVASILLDHGASRRVGFTDVEVIARRAGHIEVADFIKYYNEPIYAKPARRK